MRPGQGEDAAGQEDGSVSLSGPREITSNQCNNKDTSNQCNNKDTSNECKFSTTSVSDNDNMRQGAARTFF